MLRASKMPRYQGDARFKARKRDRALSWRELVSTFFFRGEGGGARCVCLVHNALHNLRENPRAAMYVCMVITYSRVRINRVRLPILLVVS